MAPVIRCAYTSAGRAWDRDAKHEFIQEVKKHEKTHIPY